MASTTFLLGLLFGAASCMELTPENYDDATRGKSVFIKFYAPWCGHCATMKPAWDALTLEFAEHPTKMLAEVDCTDEGGGKELCARYEVKSFPTLIYGNADDLVNFGRPYGGARDEAVLRTFINEKVAPFCSPTHLEACDAAMKAKIAKYNKMSKEELRAAVLEKQVIVAKAEAEFEAEFEILKPKKQILDDERDAKIDAINKGGLSLMKEVAAARGITIDEAAEKTDAPVKTAGVNEEL
ncbi:thioredoxin-like protein [Pelagophyceae sp. CCMP2097]|nr:thioredoxin-like protein [Pelagophyceae sp. CCMP2097]